MKTIVQVFSFDLVSKILIGLFSIILIRYMPAVEYAKYTFAIAIIVVVSQTLASSFNRIYIVGYEHFNLKESHLSFLGCQLIGIGVLILISIPFQSKYNGIYWMIVGLV